MSLITGENISFAYPGGPEVIHDLNFEFGTGERIAMIGQNGSGKSTLSKIMNGLLKAKAGTLWIEDVDARHMTAAEIANTIGYVFQNPDDQIFNSTVYKEIAYILKYKKRPSEEIDKKVIWAAGMTGLLDVLEENPYDLPYSMRKFVAIASVMVMEPKLIIMDEPTAGQDKPGKDCLKRIINTLVEEGKTVVTVCHDMEFVVNNFPRIIVMSEGRIIADEGKAVFERPEILERAFIKAPFASNMAKVSGVKEDWKTIEDIVKQMQNVKA